MTTPHPGTWAHDGHRWTRRVAVHPTVLAVAYTTPDGRHVGEVHVGRIGPRPGLRRRVRFTTTTLALALDEALCAAVRRTRSRP